jgi:hypothetical protein
MVGLVGAVVNRVGQHEGLLEGRKLGLTDGQRVVVITVG